MTHDTSPGQGYSQSTDTTSSSSETHWLRRLPLLRGLVEAFSIDYRTLALFRVLIASIILVDLFIRCQDFAAFFTDAGVVTRAQILNYYGSGSWSVYFLNGSAWFAALMVTLSVVAAVALLVGYRTRLATIVSWVLLVSLHMRNPLLLSGADDLMRVLLFWGMFLPLGARYSVDSALDKNHTYSTDSHFSAATIAILMQVMYVYWAGALLKTGAEWTQHYTAVEFALNAEHYTTWLGHWFVNTVPQLLPWLTQFVYLIELYGPLFLVAPIFLLWFRLPILGLLILMHVGFVVMLNVGHFPYVSITSLLLFLPGAVWVWLGHRVSARGEGVEIYYDKGCDFCLKTVRILQQLLLLPKATVAPAQDHPVAGPLMAEHDSWVLKTPNQEPIIEWRAVIELVSYSPVFFWVKWPMRILLVGNLGDRLYHWIGDNRMLLGKITARVLPWRERRNREPWLVQLVVVLLALMVLQINLSYVSRVPKISSELALLRNTMGLWQKWNMFAPYPVRSTKWPIIEGVREDGSRVDLFRDALGAAPTDKPDNLAANFSSYRWRKYLERLYMRKYHHYRGRYALYQCRRWNRLQITQPQNQIFHVHIRTGVQNTVLAPAASPLPAQITNQGMYSCS